MPFVPHTEDDVRRMLDAIDAPDIEALFDEIPKDLLSPKLDGLPPALSEMGITRLMHERAAQDGMPLNFIGAGAYEHHIPAAVWQITTRGEFYTAYTPYQAEASQGSLQLLYEYQSMMCGLTGMDVSNASLYDGASAVAEAVLMAIRSQRKIKNRRVLVPGALHPFYSDTTRAIVTTQDIELVELPYCADSGTTLADSLAVHEADPPAALVIAQPNFFGNLEDVDALTDWAAEHNVFVIAVVNPLSLALLKPPGEWGAKGAGADVVCGEGQPLGAPLSSGGPYFGFMACKQAHVRQMPGRIAGRTVDLEGKPGFTLTLQAREQHIRRSKATSNICTNQGLLVTAATIHMALLGPEGLRRVASHSMANTAKLAARLLGDVAGVSLAFTTPRFHEFVLRLPRPADEVAAAMAEQGILAGLPLGRFYPEFADCLLVCATETKTDEDIARYAKALAEVLK